MDHDQNHNHNHIQDETPSSEPPILTTPTTIDVLTSYCLPELPCPPFHHIDGVSNFRDIGGYPVRRPAGSTGSSTSTNSSSSYGSVRRGFIFRSALPTRITPRGSTQLVSDLHIHTIYDFRSQLETDKEPSRPIPGTTRHHVPVFPSTDTSPAQLARRMDAYMSPNGTEGFVYAYSEILKHGPPAYRKVLEHVRDRPDEPFLVHCTGGKDRTGVFVALVLRLAGVEDVDVVAREYELTEIGLAGLMETVVEGLVREGKIRGDRDAVRRLLSAKKENLKAAMKWLDETYGSVEGYLMRELGFSQEDLHRIRTNLVDANDPGIF